MKNNLRASPGYVAHAPPSSAAGAVSVSAPRMLASLGGTHAAVLGMMVLIGDQMTPLASILTLSIVGLAAVVLLNKLVLSRFLDGPALTIVAAAFIVRLSVGIVHYLLLIHPGYFEDPAGYTYLWDFEWMHESMIVTRNFWLDNSLLSPLPDWYLEWNKNAYLLAYAGILYYFCGVLPLNMTFWNTLHILYSAALISHLATRCGASRKQAMVALILVAFEPFGFISSHMARDSLGQFALVLGFYLLMICRDRLGLLILVTPLASFLGYSYRQPYLIAMSVTAVYVYTVRRFKSIFSGVAAIAGVVVSMLVATVLFSSVADQLYVLAFERFEDSSNMELSLLAFPIRVIRGMIGPWPWYQLWLVENWEFMLPNFLQHVLNLGIYVVLVKMGLERSHTPGPVDPGVILGLLLFFIGVQATGIHSPYVSVGTVFFLPTACKVSSRIWAPLLISIFLLFITGNILYWGLGLTGSGLSGVS